MITTAILSMLIKQLLLVNFAQSSGINNGRQVLVLAPPSRLNPYYKERFEEVIPFYVDFFSNVKEGTDDAVLIADEETMPYFKGKIPDNRLILGRIEDPRIRDVSPPISSIDVQFTYIGGGSLAEAQNIQSIYNSFIHKYKIKPMTMPLYLDGGNLVNNNYDKVITTRKFLTDNGFNEQEGVDALKEKLGVDYVSILTSVEPKLSHSEGLAAYVCDNTIYMHIQQEPEHQMMKKELMKGCPHCDIIEVEGFYDDREFKEGYASSCGVYVNCVVTENYIYVPIFNHPDTDKAAQDQFKNNPCGKKVVPIDASRVCVIGAGLRSSSWQTSGQYANKLLGRHRKQLRGNYFRRDQLWQKFQLDTHRSKFEL